MKKLICFDLDNTLIYSDKSHFLAYNYALNYFKLKPRSFNFLTSLFGMPHQRVIEIIAPKLNEREIKKFTKVYNDFLIKNSYQFAKAIPSVTKTLKNLNKDYDLAILSNSSHKTILALLKGAKINKNLFKFIIGHDQVKHSKPWPDEIFKAERLDNHKAEFMVGDSIYDVIAGNKANVKTIAVLTGSYSKIILKKQNPDYIIKSVKELPRLLKEINDKI